MIVHMVPGSNTKPSEENIGMFETAVMVAVVDVLCNSLMSEEHNISLLLITRHTNTHPELGKLVKHTKWTPPAINISPSGPNSRGRDKQTIL